MKPIFFFLLLPFVTANLNAQNNPVNKADTVIANTADVNSVDAIIASLYAVISGAAGEKRDWNRMRSLFLPEAKMVATGNRPNGEIIKRVMTVEDYITTNGPVLEKNGFFETEIFRRQEVFGRIAHCFSTYAAKKTATDATPFMRGINSIQLYNDGKRWWILSIFWQAENADLSLPKQYLPQQ